MRNIYLYLHSGVMCCHSFIAFLTALLQQLVAPNKFWLTRVPRPATWRKVHEWEEVEKVTLIIFVLTTAS